MPHESALTLFAIAAAALIFCIVATFYELHKDAKRRDKLRRPFGPSGFSL